MIATAHSNVSSDILSIGKLSAKYSISQPTIRQMCDEGLPHFTTLGGHRRISDKDFREFIGIDESSSTTLPRVCLLARVSTPSQAKPRTDGPDAQSDLDRQVERIRAYITERWGTDCQVTENIRVGSGLNFNHPKIIEFTTKLVNREYDYVVISYKDRLARSSFDLFSNLAKQAGTEIIMVDEQDDPSYEESLISDLIALATVAACKHNSAKAAKNSTIQIEQEYLVRIFKQYRQGMSYRDLSTWCEKEGITGTKGQRISPPKLHKILTTNQQLLEKLVPAEPTDIERFISEGLRADSTAKTKQVDIYSAYQSWCSQNGCQALSAKKMGLAVKQAGYAPGKGKRGMKVFAGLALA